MEGRENGMGRLQTKKSREILRRKREGKHTEGIRKEDTSANEDKERKERRKSKEKGVEK